jgi:predicted acetyltransferase
MAPNAALRLRPLRVDDETQAKHGHEVMAVEDWEFVLGYQPEGKWETFVESVQNRAIGVGLPDTWVPETFLVAVDAHNTIVGRISIRHRLSPFLLQQGGHIGYGVLPDHRRRGHATEMLRQGLIIARSLGIDRVLITCDEDNTASRRVIERHGGQFENHYVPSNGATPTRRYWID